MFLNLISQNGQLTFVCPIRHRTKILNFFLFTYLIRHHGLRDPGNNEKKSIFSIPTFSYNEKIYQPIRVDSEAYNIRKLRGVWPTAQRFSETFWHTVGEE